MRSCLYNTGQVIWPLIDLMRQISCRTVLSQSAHGDLISANGMLFPTLKHIGSTVWALKVSYPKEAIDAKLSPYETLWP